MFIVSYHGLSPILSGGRSSVICGKRSQVQPCCVVASHAGPVALAGQYTPPAQNETFSSIYCAADCLAPWCDVARLCIRLALSRVWGDRRFIVQTADEIGAGMRVSVFPRTSHHAIFFCGQD